MRYKNSTKSLFFAIIFEKIVRFSEKYSNPMKKMKMSVLCCVERDLGEKGSFAQSNVSKNDTADLTKVKIKNTKIVVFYDHLIFFKKL